MAEWETLFDKAVYCLDSCVNTSSPWMKWSMGGGTALMLRFWHRRSKDIDIFINDVQFLTLLSPRLNEAVDAIASDYVEAFNFIKLRLPEGEIDFIAAPHLTDDPWEGKELRGRSILLETPEEIVVKKMFHRAETLQTRDIFDIAVVLQNSPECLENNLNILSKKAFILDQRLKLVKSRYLAEARAHIDVMPAGEPLLDDAPNMLADFLAKLLSKS